MKGEVGSCLECGGGKVVEDGKGHRGRVSVVSIACYHEAEA